MTSPTSSLLLDSFRRDRARGTNDDITLSLRPAYSELLAKLGNPQTKLPPVFHVAGTNGKGSTCAFLRSILEAAGYRVHVYTSPHLVRFHERIRLAGKLIEEAELVEFLQTVKNLSVPNSITYFEAATAVAFAAFAKHPADFTIVEVGLGGRLDATNVIPKPLASIITRLSFDHRDYLGDTMTAIAREKAGIMRAHVPCFSAAQPNDEAFVTLHEAANQIQAPFFTAGKDWRVEKTAQGFLYQDRNHEFELPSPALLGEHQYDNAGLAIAALMGVRGSGFRVQDIAAGLQKVEWPARLQRITQGRLAAQLPQGFEFWLDGGHNDSAGEALAHQAERWRTADKKPLHLMAGMLTTKHPKEFLAPLQAYINSMQTVVIPDEVASFTAEDLAMVARDAGIKNVTAETNIETALRNLVSTSTTPQRILICGSLYLAGHVLNINSTET